MLAALVIAMLAGCTEPLGRWTVPSPHIARMTPTVAGVAASVEPRTIHFTDGRTVTLRPGAWALSAPGIVEGELVVLSSLEDAQWYASFSPIGDGAWFWNEFAIDDGDYLWFDNGLRLPKAEGFVPDSDGRYGGVWQQCLLNANGEVTGYS